MLKKIIYFLLIVMMLVSFSIVVLANKEISIDSQDIEIVSGEQKTLVLSFENAPEIESLFLEPKYDSNVIEIVSGKWLISGMVTDWDKTFEFATYTANENETVSINQEIFELTIKLKNNVPIGTKATIEMAVSGTGLTELDEYITLDFANITVSCPHDNTVEKEKIPAKCNQGGYEAGTWCNDCKAYIVGGAEIPATNIHSDEDGKWNTDANKHWHICECGVKFDEAIHTGGETLGKCSVCNIEYGSVTGVALDKTTATLTEGETLALKATVAPENAINKTVTWTSSDEVVATVANGVVTAKSAGTAIITVTTEDGGHNASCAVTVCPKTLTFSLDERKATVGKTVEINLNITNNPGIAGMGFEIEYNSDVMTLVSYESNSAWLPTSNFDEDNSNNPVKFVWSRASNFKADTSILTLKFEIEADAPEGDYVVTLAKSGDIINQKFDDLACNVVSGKITVIDYIAGDVNSDFVVDIRDAVVLAQHLANWSVYVDMNAADCNADGFVDTKDAVLLARYLAKWDVTLG